MALSSGHSRQETGRTWALTHVWLLSLHPTAHLVEMQEPQHALGKEVCVCVRPSPAEPLASLVPSGQETYGATAESAALTALALHWHSTTLKTAWPGDTTVVKLLPLWGHHRFGDNMVLESPSLDHHNCGVSMTQGTPSCVHQCSGVTTTPGPSPSGERYP